MTAEDALPYVWVGIVVIGIYFSWILIRAGKVLAARKWRSAWRASVRLVGWLPLLIAGLLLGGFALFAPIQNRAEVNQFGVLNVMATFLPLIAGCHLAFAFSPADEPALEVLLSAPRPVVWILVERVILIATPYILLALIGNAVIYTRFSEEFAGMFLRWLPPFLFFIAISVLITLSSRQAAFGMTLTMVLWFALAFMGDGMVFRWPHLWPLHIYLQPEQATSAATFSLHQTWVVVASLGMLARAAAQLSNSEKLLSASKS